MTVPLWLLDVDGVLNAVGVGPPEPVWSTWQRGTATTDGGRNRWPIAWSPEVVEAIVAWRAGGLVEVAWLTTWGGDANHELAALLGLPELPVAAVPPHRPPPLGASAVATAHAQVAGAHAADPLTGRWWKFDVVRDLHAADPARPFVWTDDDLAYEPRIRDWVAEHTLGLAVAPDPSTGLTPEELTEIEAYLHQHRSTAYR